MMAGRLNEIVTIYSPTTVKNRFGEAATEYTATITTRAAVEWASGTRTVENDEIVYPTTKRFQLRSYAPVTNTSQIEWQANRYRVITVEHRRAYNDIMVTAALINE